MLKEFIREEEGQNLVAYALLLSFIPLVASIALPEQASQVFNQVFPLVTGELYLLTR